jgi:major membrane immunogen (membrane-anchored lipoprotein)
MNKTKISLTILFIAIAISTTSFNNGKILSSALNVLQDTVYKDGTYSGQSRASYIYEPYWGKVVVTIKNGSFSDISFSVRDSNLHEPFDGNYEKHFTGNPVYIQQSRNDWKGVQEYPKKLVETGDINKVDATSGATWSYNIFKASLNEALKNAK